MQRQKTIALMVALIMGTSATAYALNVGVINATRPKPAAASVAPAAQEVTTIIVDIPYDTGPAPVEAAAPVVAVEAQSVATPVARVVAPAAAPAAASPPAAAPAPEPAQVVAQQATPAAQSEPVAASVSYETFAAGPAGSVVLAHTGNTIEFWAAYTANGWNYQVETAKGQEIVVKYRLGESEMVFIAKVKGGQVLTKVEGPSGGGEEDD